jgi:hypothetical protein
MGGEGSMAYMVHIMNQRMERVKQMRNRQKDAISYDKRNPQKEVVPPRKIDPVKLKKFQKELEKDIKREKTKSTIIYITIVIFAIIGFYFFLTTMNVF